MNKVINNNYIKKMTYQKFIKLLFNWILFVILLSISFSNSDAQVKRKPPKSVTYHQKLQKKLMYKDPKCLYIFVDDTGGLWITIKSCYDKKITAQPILKIR